VRRVGVAVALGLLLTSVACDALAPAAERCVCPEDCVVPGAYDGAWVGETSEGERITITVEDGWVRSIETNFNLQTVAAGATRPATWRVGVPIVRDRIHGYYSIHPWFLGFLGIFEDGELTGALHVEWIDPQGNLGRRHVVYGATRENAAGGEMLIY